MKFKKRIIAAVLCISLIASNLLTNVVYAAATTESAESVDITATSDSETEQEQDKTSDSTEVEPEVFPIEEEKQDTEITEDTIIQNDVIEEEIPEIELEEEVGYLDPLTDEEIMELLNGSELTQIPDEDTRISMARYISTGKLEMLWATDKKLGVISELKSGYPHGKLLMMRIKTGSKYSLGYCIEYGASIHSGDGAGSSSTLDRLGANEKALLRYALLFGFGDKEHSLNSFTNKQYAEYAATQAMVWVIVHGKYGTSQADSIARKVCDASRDPNHAWNYYTSIKNNINSCQTVPSFSTRSQSTAPEITLKWNASNKRFEATVTDSNKVLSHFNYSIPGVSIVKNGNSMTLYTKSILNGSVNGSASRNIGVSGGSVLYWTGTEKKIQELASVNWDGTYPDPVKSFIKVKTQPLQGEIKLIKKNSYNNEYLPGATFALYEWNGSTYKLLGNMIDNKDGTYKWKEKLTVNGTNEGKFKIVETASPPHFINGKFEKEFNITTMNQVISYEVKNDPIRSRVKIPKTDSETGVILGNAVFTIFEYNKDTGKYTAIATMKQSSEYANNYVSNWLHYSLKNQGKFKIEETKAPTGYYGDWKDLYNNVKNSYLIQLTDEMNGKFFTITKGESDKFINTPQKGRIQITKKGDVLTGIESDGNEGVTFIYTEQNIANAKYNIVAATDIKSPDGKTVMYKKDQVVETLVTKTDGTAISKELYLGTYKVIETAAPSNFTKPEKEADRTHTVTLTYQGETVKVFTVDDTFRNDRPSLKVKAIKKSSNDGYTLEGAIFGVYADNDIKDINNNVIVKKGTLLQKVSSNYDGEAIFTVDLPINNKYVIKEIQAPEGYYESNKEFQFSYNYTNDTKYVYEFQDTWENKEVRGDIYLYKEDKESETNIAQGDASLENAKYGLFAAQDIKYPNKKQGNVYEKDQLVAIEYTDKEGKLCFKNHYLGKYYVKEIEASEGYLVDETRYDIDLNYEGQSVEIVKRELTSQEMIKKQAFEMIKVGSDGQTSEATLLRAGFEIYLISSLDGVQNGKIKPNGNGKYSFEQFRGYDFSNETTALDFSSNKKGEPIPELFTDDKGFLRSPELAYGQYVVIESTTPPEYGPIDPFIVEIEDDSRVAQAWRVFIDWEFSALLKIYKIDGTSKKPVLHAGATFKIFDIDRGKYVVQYTHYPTLVKHEEFRTSDEGYLITPEKLKPGNYRLEEIEAPEGYVKSDPIEIQISSNHAYEVEEETGAIIITEKFVNERQVGELNLLKKGEHLKDTHVINEPSLLRKIGQFFKLVKTEDKEWDFDYDLGPVEGAKFEIRASEVIYSPDYQVDESGSRIVLYDKDELVQSLTTDAKGEAKAENLPLGAYKVYEIIAGENFVLNKEVKEFVLEYAGDSVEVVYSDMEYINQRQKVLIKVKKIDYDSEQPVEGAIFGLYNKEDILNKAGDVILPANSLIEKSISDESGNVTFKADLPITKYYVRELEARPGYILSDEVLDFDFEYSNQDIDVIELEAVLKNDYTKTDISKVDIAGEEIPGAELCILDEDRNEVVSWTSTGTPFRIDKLKPGKYFLVETAAPEGYEIAKEIEFFVTETGEINSVTMVDEYVKTAKIKVVKIGDMLVGVSQYDSAYGKINRLEYEKKSLPGVEFTVYDENDEVVDVIVTNDEGLTESRDLPIGTYTVKETKTPAGLAMNHKVYEVTLEKGDDEKVVDVSLDVENHVVDTEINVYKIGEMINPENDTFGYGSKPLEGVFFGIYTNEKITSYDEKIVLDKDKLIGVIKTDETGKAALRAALVSGKYYYKELETLEGYELDQEKHEFELNIENEPLTIFDVNKENPLLNTLKKAKVTLIKVDATDTNKKLSGAVFVLYTEDGTKLGSYTTNDNGEIIVNELGYGKYYFIEEKAPDGYQRLGDKIFFEVKDTDVTITCQNHLIPKLGFEDSFLIYAISFVALAGTALVGAALLYYYKRRKKQPKKILK